MACAFALPSKTAYESCNVNFSSTDEKVVPGRVDIEIISTDEIDVVAKIGATFEEIVGIARLSDSLSKLEMRSLLNYTVFPGTHKIFGVGTVLVRKSIELSITKCKLLVWCAVDSIGFYLKINAVALKYFSYVDITAVLGRKRRGEEVENFDGAMAKARDILSKEGHKTDDKSDEEILMLWDYSGIGPTHSTLEVLGKTKTHPYYIYMAPHPKTYLELSGKKFSY